MLKDVVEVKALGGHKVYLKYEDGVEGVFEPLKNYEQFAKLYLNRELGTICWPGGADLDPDVLYARITKKAIPAF